MTTTQVSVPGISANLHDSGGVYKFSHVGDSGFSFVTPLDDGDGDWNTNSFNVQPFSEDGSGGFVAGNGYEISLGDSVYVNNIFAANDSGVFYYSVGSSPSSTVDPYDLYFADWDF